MEQKVVRKFEAEIEEAVAAVISRLGLRYLPMLPSQRTMHLMAKAAVTVYETAVENQRERPDER
jgi:tRNA(Leu) C34 or U34 (ribose-2'-O)-methylase TrmL